MTVARPCWVTPDGPDHRAQDLYKVLAHVDAHGLDPERYKVTKISFLFNSDRAEDRFELDSLLTQALVQLAMDLRFGRKEARAADGDGSKSAERDESAERAVQAEAHKVALNPESDVVGFLRSLLPQHRQYGKMMRALETYRQLALSGGWPSVPQGRSIKPGELDSRIPVIAERLRVSEDLGVEPVSLERFDAGLVQAVEHFQRRHGLPSDGIVGKQTVDAMNVTAEERVAQIAVNLERWRWLDRDLGERFVMVNLAGFEVLFVKQTGETGEVLFRAPVIVGKPFLRTPVFSSKLRYLELNPYWNVPKSIEVKEVLPKEQKSPGYMASQHMQFIDTGRSKRIRQEPGPWNALGVVKFIFPNPYDVYLHDTPTKKLFEATTRTFSHGCIRVKDPLTLAELLLGGQATGWGAERIADIIREGKNVRVPLPQEISIHIVYRTAWVDVDDSINFRSDVYGRDSRLANALAVGR